MYIDDDCAGGDYKCSTKIRPLQLLEGWQSARVSLWVFARPRHLEMLGYLLSQQPRQLSVTACMQRI